MALKLVKGSYEYKNQIIDMLKEWIAYNEQHPKADSTFFCFDDQRNIMVGAVNIRHDLNEYLLKYGGHIGDGVRPSERRKGYATKMINLALKECKKLKIKRVLLVCDKNNIGSAKSIINNGGILENEVINDDKIIQRYWIDLE